MDELIERPARPAYGLLLAMLSAELVVLAVTDFTVTFGPVILAAIAAAMAMLLGIVTRKCGFSRLGGAVEGTALVVMIGAANGFATLMLARLSLPFADDALLGADRMLGFDWLALLRFEQANPWLWRASAGAYGSMFAQMIMLPFALFLLGERQRVWTFIIAWGIAGIVSALIFPFVPVAGPYVRLGLTPADVPQFTNDWLWQTGVIISHIRDGSVQDVGQTFGGLVSFPSFHTAAAVLFMWLTWPLLPMRFTFLALNGLLIFGTLIQGGHYLIDLPAGALIAGMAICAARRLSSVKSNG